MLPRPPKTTMASIMIKGCIHMCGSSTTRGTTMAPAMAARPTETAIAHMATAVTFIPMRLATSRSSAVERMARPTLVFIRKKRTPTSTARATPRAKRCCQVTLTPKITAKPETKGGTPR